MPSLTIVTPQTALSLKSQSILIKPLNKDGAHPTQVALDAISQVTISKDVHISSAVIHALLTRKIPLHFMDWNGAFLGSFQPPSPPRAKTRLRQYELSNRPEEMLPLAQRLILSKMHNEQRIVQRLFQRTHQPKDSSAIAQMKALVAQCLHATSLESLRGLEGCHAKVFFSTWGGFLPPEFPFGERSTQPPANPVNAAISYLSAILYSELLSATRNAGLDEALGVLHTPTEDRYSLPLDLMEPFRPAIIYPLVAKLFNQQILKAENFEAHEQGIWLTSEGKRSLQQQYEKMMIREFYSSHLDHRTTLRTQLEKAPMLYKLALDSPQAFLPFQLNGTPKTECPR